MIISASLSRRYSWQLGKPPAPGGSKALQDHGEQPMRRLQKNRRIGPEQVVNILQGQDDAFDLKARLAEVE
jgi:hypothetical protein